MPPKKRHPWQKPWKPGRKQTPVKAPQRTKARRVFALLEIETNKPLAELTKSHWCAMTGMNVLQAQVNVVQK